MAWTAACQAVSKWDRNPSPALRVRAQGATRPPKPRSKVRFLAGLPRDRASHAPVPCKHVERGWTPRGSTNLLSSDGSERCLVCSACGWPALAASPRMLGTCASRRCDFRRELFARGGASSSPSAQTLNEAPVRGEGSPHAQGGRVSVAAKSNFAREVYSDARLASNQEDSDRSRARALWIACAQSRLARHLVANENQAGSIPAVRSITYVRLSFVNAGYGAARQLLALHRERQREAARARGESRRCLYCGKALTYEKRNNRYCDHTCSARATNGSRAEDLYCTVCERRLPRGNRRRKTCSRACRDSGYIQAWLRNEVPGGSGSWIFARIREWLLNEAGYQCSLCSRRRLDQSPSRESPSAVPELSQSDADVRKSEQGSRAKRSIPNKFRALMS